MCPTTTVDTYRYRAPVTTPTSPHDDRAQIPPPQHANYPANSTVTSQPPSRRRWVWIAAAAVALLAAAGVGGWLVLRPSTADRAATACQELVSERLKSPATAQFPEPQVQERGAAGDAFLVTGEVDSQNGFGAMVRSSYSCELYTPDGGQSWKNNGVRVS